MSSRVVEFRGNSGRERKEEQDGDALFNGARQYNYPLLEKYSYFLK